jgi:hypothetical protein
VRIFLNQSFRDARDEASWPEVYPWFGEKLSLLYEKVLVRSARRSVLLGASEPVNEFDRRSFEHPLLSSMDSGCPGWERRSWNTVGRIR